MKLSIIIVSFNTEKLILEAISTSLKEDLDLEVIVIDNASKDGSVEAVEKLASGDKRVKLIKNKENLGFAKANNQGIKASSGKHVFLLNSDCELKSGTLKKLFDFAESTPDAAVIGARLLNPGGSVQPSCYFFGGVIRVLKRYFGGENEIDKYYPKGASPAQVEAVVFAATLITRRALDRIGLLDERYFMYFEDLDYCRRAKGLGLRVYYYPGASVVHYHGASGRDEADSANQWRRLIPSSKIYHGVLKHYLIVAVMKLGQKWEKLLKRN